MILGLTAGNRVDRLVAAPPHLEHVVGSQDVAAPPPRLQLRVSAAAATAAATATTTARGHPLAVGLHRETAVSATRISSPLYHRLIAL